MKYFFTILFCATLLGSCNMFEYSPNQAFDRNSPRDLNRINLERLRKNTPDDTIRFILTGDSQRAYQHSQDLVAKINSIKNVDFVFLAGDISDFGLLNEMEWVNEIFSKLMIPYFGVIGNHDLVANGENIYKNMYGPLNFSFVYGGIKFICHNTNSRESNFDGKVPDIGWLNQQLQPEDGINGFVSVAHVPPFSNDFDPSLAAEYGNVINSAENTLAALYAHTHTEEILYPFDGRIPYIVTSNIAGRQCLLIEIINGQLSYESIKY